MCGKWLATHFHDSPSFLLAQISPLVVPKYNPSESRPSLVIAWRFTVHHACPGGKPLSWRRHVFPPLVVRKTAGLPSGAVRGQTLDPSIGKTQAVSGSRGCSSIGKPMFPTFFGI